MLTAILLILGCYALIAAIALLAWRRNRAADVHAPVDYFEPSRAEVRAEFDAIVARTWGAGVRQRPLPRPRRPRSEGPC